MGPPWTKGPADERGRTRHRTVPAVHGPSRLLVPRGRRRLPALRGVLPTLRLRVRGGLHVPRGPGGLITFSPGVLMADITRLILADHEWFREQFAKLDYLEAQETPRPEDLERVWRPLGDKLDVHAYAEESIFYPQLLK